MVTVRQNLSPRRYEFSDLDKIAELMANHFDISEVQKRKFIFDWVAGHSPRADGEPCYLVIEDENNIVAYEGRMPVDIMIRGQKEKGYFFHDTLVHPDYRKKGLGLTLVNQLKTTWEETTDTFAVGVWMNEFTHEILKRRGYLEINANYFVKPINLESSIKNFVRNSAIARLMALQVKGLTELYDFLTECHYSDRNIVEISRFDQRVDEFALRISPKFNLIVLRNSEYLNWKYVDRPFADYAMFAVERSNELTGYIILQPTQVGDMKIGVIVDILADPDDSRTINLLCRQAIRHFKEEKVDYISCLLTNKKFIKIFHENLFFTRRKTAPVMIGNLHKHKEQEMLRNIDNWYLTCGDSDGFMWL